MKKYLIENIGCDDNNDEVIEEKATLFIAKTMQDLFNENQDLKNENKQLKKQLEDMYLTLMHNDNEKAKIIEELELQIKIKDDGFKVSTEELCEYAERINKAIEILKLCNSKCARETIEILKGE